MNFTQDWFSHNISNFEFCMSALETKQDFLEIGCFEGRASVWMLQNGLDPDGKLTCIDTFQGSEEHAAMGLNLNELFDTFKQNIEEGKVADQVVEGIRATSYEGLARSIHLGDRYDFIYVDGSHIAPDVMTDACMAFGLLKPGGIMLFDDYLWKDVPGILHRPKLAVDLFVTLFSEKAELLMLGYQLAVRKI
jgi:predicted O-methyltransferase YrrM